VASGQVQRSSSVTNLWRRLQQQYAVRSAAGGWAFAESHIRVRNHLLEVITSGVLRRSPGARSCWTTRRSTLPAWVQVAPAAKPPVEQLMVGGRSSFRCADPIANAANWAAIPHPLLSASRSG